MCFRLQEIPITTGEVLGSSNTNPFRQIERQDVGIQLEVRPQINDGDTIKLFIRQEVSSVFGPVSDGFSELVTNKREIETTVMVDDGEIIVLGGLIEDDRQSTVDKIPILGDVPVIGRAFRSEGRSKEKTNLMVFIRPTILRNVDDVRSVTSEKYNYMRAEQALKSRDGTTSMDSILGEVMGVSVPASGSSR
jgi:general secretion pathway protein D